MKYSVQVRPEFFTSWFTNPPTVISWKVEKKIISIFFYILSADSKYYLFSWKK